MHDTKTSQTKRPHATQISATLSDESINIENLSSRSKKEVGYSVFEISGKCTEGVVEKLKSIDGVIRVYIIKNK
jgi:D-3-phosphoglycerate dehydrogenase